MTLPPDRADLYARIDALLQQRYADYPRRVEPAWSRLNAALHDLGHNLDRAAAHQPGPDPAPDTIAAADRIADAPVFIAGYYKTGTTALLGLLEGHPALCVLPFESRYFSLHLPAYENLSPYVQTRILLDTWLGRLITTGGKPPFWALGRPEPGQPDPYAAFARALAFFTAQRTPADLLAVVAQAYAAARIAQGQMSAESVRYWVEKTPTTEKRLDMVLAAYPAARFVHIIRDPRSTVASIQRMSQRRGQTDYSLELDVAEIAESFDLARENQQRLGTDRYHILRYEDMVTDAARVMPAVVDFLGIDWDESLLAPSIAGEPLIANSAWQNSEVAGQLHQHSLDRWRDQLDAATLDRIAAITGEAARAHGYDLPLPPPLLPPPGPARQLARRVIRRGRGLARRGVRLARCWAAERAPWNQPPRLDRPIFIWGAPRSGTTLLYQMISQHPAVAYPVNAAGQPREGTAYWWDAFGEQRGPAPASLADAASVRQVRAAYADLLRAQGKPRLLDKTPFMLLWIPLVNVVFPDARHIHIVRDGRAVVNSILYKLRCSEQDKDQAFVAEQVLYGPCPPELTDPLALPPAERHAQQWRLLVQHGQATRALLGERYIELRYEDLTAQPRETMRTVLAHAQLPADEDFLAAHYAERLENRNSKWQSPDAAPAQDSFTAHSALTDDDWPALRAIAPDLRALGYDDTMPDVPE